MDLQNMAIEELEALRVMIDAEIAARSPEPDTFTFDFEATSDPRKGMPYVAILKGLDGEGKLDRTFLDLDRSYGKKEVTVSGTYQAKTGDILELQYGGSWKNKYRDYCLVTASGELHTLGCTSDSQLTSQIKKALRGEIDRDELLTD